MIVMSPTDPLPIQRFWPFSTHPSPERTALVSRPTASEPCAGSVRPKAPSFSARASGPSHSSCCSGEPSRCRERMVRPPWTAVTVASDPSIRATSMLTRPAASGDSGALPPGTGTPSASRSSSPIRRTRCSGYSAFSQASLTSGNASSASVRARSQAARSAPATSAKTS
ncbi:hypothetical protein SDC9_141600 [bioreactor metagenome]|uniref:Uncharacterized protein n=1 Tax=bioreactor metagenome TaxID=1076179 RepID=A0A645DY46_9ZZZZ